MYFDCVSSFCCCLGMDQYCFCYRNALGYKIVGYPVRIDSQRYARNAFYFNLCFVCDSWARSVQYEPVVKKLAEYLVCFFFFLLWIGIPWIVRCFQIMMEDETGFLSKEENKTRIQELLIQVLQDLNENQVTTIVGRY